MHIHININYLTAMAIGLCLMFEIFCYEKYFTNVISVYYFNEYNGKFTIYKFPRGPRKSIQ